VYLMKVSYPKQFKIEELLYNFVVNCLSENLRILYWFYFNFVVISGVVAVIAVVAEDFKVFSIGVEF